MYISKLQKLTSACVKVDEFNGYEISIAFDDSHVGGVLFRGGIRVYDSSLHYKDITDTVFDAKGNDIPATIDNLLIAVNYCKEHPKGE